MPKYSAVVSYRTVGSTVRRKKSIPEFEASSPAQAANLARKTFRAGRSALAPNAIDIRVEVTSEGEVRLEIGQIIVHRRHKALVAAIYSTRNGPIKVVLEAVHHGGVCVRSLEELMRELDEEKVEIVAIYPSGDLYVQGNPIRNSIHGVDQLIQIRVTKRGGRIVKKELI